MDRRKRTARTVALMSLFSMTDTQENVPVASFDGDGSDLISLIVGIDPVQAGSGDPSPDNVRPISGWAGANIHVSPTTDAADGETYTITFPTSAGTVYGGTLDVTTGKLTVDRAMVDLGTLNWSGWTDSVGFIFNAPVSGRLQTRNDPAISSQYSWNPYVSVWTDLVNGQMTGQIGGANVYVRDTRYSSIADFKTAVSGVQLVYPLATPIVYDLTPTEVSTLLGTNNIFADTGDIKYIEYNI